MIAVIIPYRNRIENLALSVRGIQEYVPLSNIYVAEQADDGLFSRSMLINACFKELPKNTTHVIVHDADMIPMSWDISPCSEIARLISHGSPWQDSGGRWSIPYRTFFGGSSMISVDTFRKVDGYNNRFRGWGFEDDDFAYRYFGLFYKQDFESRQGVIYHIPHPCANTDEKAFFRNRRIHYLNSSFKFATHIGLSSLNKRPDSMVKFVSTGMICGCKKLSFNILPINIDADNIMTKDFIKKRQLVLEEILERLSGTSARKAVRSCSSDEMPADLNDVSSIVSAADSAMAIMSNSSKTRLEVELALKKIQTNAGYGICEVTGKPIGIERLEAIPWARLSIEAQRELESTGRRPVNRGGKLFDDASKSADEEAEEVEEATK